MKRGNILSYESKRTLQVRWPWYGMIFVAIPLIVLLGIYEMPRQLLLREHYLGLLVWSCSLVAFYGAGFFSFRWTRGKFKPRIFANVLSAYFGIVGFLLLLLGYGKILSSITATDSFFVQCKKTAFILYADADENGGVFPADLESMVRAGKLEVEQLYHPFHLPINASSTTLVRDSDIVYAGGSLRLPKNQIDWGKIIVFETRDLFWDHSKVVGFADGSCHSVPEEMINQIEAEDKFEKHKIGPQR